MVTHTMIARLLVAVLAVALLSGPQCEARDQVKRIDVLAEPINHLEIENMTAIRFTGGLSLRSGSSRFGGWSGLATKDGGTNILAISDEGSWLKMSVQYNSSTGAPVSVRDAELGPLHDKHGKSLRSKGKWKANSQKTWTDAESVVYLDKSDANSSLLVSFERHHRVWMYESPDAPATTDDSLDFASELLKGYCEYNGGAEAIEVLPPNSNSLVMFCEDPISDAENIFLGWVVPLHGKGFLKQKQLRLKLTDQFKPTDLAVLKNGDLIILERMHNDTDTSFRLEMVPFNHIHAMSHEEAIVPACIAQGWKHPDNLVDNMEGLSVDYIDGDQAIRLSLISDDNFSSHQKTVLLVFEVDKVDELIRFGQENSIFEAHSLSDQSSTSALSSNMLFIIVGAAFFLVGLSVGVGITLIVLRIKARRSADARYENIMEMTRGDFGDLMDDRHAGL